MKEALEPHRKDVQRQYSKSVLTRFMTADQLKSFEKAYLENRLSGGSNAMPPSRETIALLNQVIKGTKIKDIADAQKKADATIRYKLYRAAFYLYVESKRGSTTA